MAHLRCEAEAEVDRVAGLHAYERAPDEDGGAVEEAGYYVAVKKDQVSVVH